MARPIKSTPVKRFFKYLGLIGAGAGVMFVHSRVAPPDNMNRSGYKATVFWIKTIFTDRGFSTKPFGETEHGDGSPFDSPPERPM